MSRAPAARHPLSQNHFFATGRRQVAINKPAMPPNRGSSPTRAGSRFGYQSQPARLLALGSPSRAADSKVARWVPPKVVTRLCCNQGSSNASTSAMAASSCKRLGPPSHRALKLTQSTGSSNTSRALCLISRAAAIAPAAASAWGHLPPSSQRPSSHRAQVQLAQTGISST